MDRVDVQAIGIALDAQARRSVQDAMRAIAQGGDTGSKAGLARMLREAVRVVIEAEASWTHALVEGGPPRPASEARRMFTEIAQRARSRFPVEVIRNANGTIATRPAPPLAASEEPGVVLVTFVVASREEIADPPDPSRREDLRRGLEALAVGEQDLVAVEVVWSPAEEADRVSIAALERRHPEIRRIAG